MRTFLTCHSFQIHPARKPKEFLRFNDLPGNNSSFRDALTTFLRQTQSSAVVDQAGAACHKIDQLHLDDEDIYGTFVSGDFGHASKFYNVRSEENTFQRSPDDAEQIPYHFLFSFADDGNKGVLITQKMGNRGIQTALRQIVHTYLSKIYDVIIDFSELIPTEVYNYLQRGEPKEVVFNHVKLPNEQISLLGWENVSVEEIANVRIVVKAKFGKALPLSEKLKNRYTSIVERRVDDNVEDTGDINIEVNYAGGTRRVHLNNPNSLSPLIDISEAVRITNGVPDYDAVLAQSKLLLLDARSRLNI